MKIYKGLNLGVFMLYHDDHNPYDDGVKFYDVNYLQGLKLFCSGTDLFSGPLSCADV